MIFTESDLQKRLGVLRQQFQKSLTDVEQEFEDHFNWLQTVRDGVKNGTINVQSILVPKTPGKRRAPLNAIRESFESTIDLDDVHPTRSNTQQKRASKKGQTKKATRNQKKAVILEEDEEEDTVLCIPAKPQKRPSEDTIDSASKRLCGSRSSETTSRDSGLSSVGSRNTRGSTLGGVVVKQELPSPKNRSIESTVTDDNVADSSYETATGRSSIPRLSSESASSNSQANTADHPPRRTRSVGRGTFVVKEEVRRSSRSHSESRVLNAETPSAAADKTLIVSSNVVSSSELLSPLSTTSKNQRSDLKSPMKSPLRSPMRSVMRSPMMSPMMSPMRSPIIKAPPAHLLKGETVKKAVKAFEAMNEDHDDDGTVGSMAPPTAINNKMLPPSKIPPPTVTQASSLDDAVNAPTRVTRTKTRAMAKAAEEVTKSQDTQTISSVSNVLKSPIAMQQQKNLLASKTVEKKPEETLERENSTLSSSRFPMKAFGSASKVPSFLKSSTPLNRINPMTPSHSASTSFSGNRVNNLITSVESFISKPVVSQEIKPSREENLQKLVAKAEVASKKKEEIMKAQMEEKIKKRQEKRMKVCAAREAMEKEKQLMQLRLEREREEKQRQLQAEREEKLRQEYLKKKRLALQKAAETEERRRQEEAARLAKLKQQEEEQKRIAAQRKKEQEEAERKHMERLQQEREAAALRIKEAERLAKEALLKTKNTPKPQLDQTYDKLPQASQCYGMTPVPEDRQPMPSSHPDNYGIDDAGTDDSSEDESKPKKMVPIWAQSKQRLPKLMDDYEVTRQQMFAFFGSKKSTPDLSKIFTAIDRRYLIRKSSAVWRTPPVKY